MRNFRIECREEFVEWIGGLGFTQSATLAFNRDITRSGAEYYLNKLHKNLSRRALQASRATMNPIEESLLSIALIEHPTTNFHFHMLWHAPQFEAKLVKAMPGIWKKLVPSGNAKNRAIVPNDPIYRYVTKELTADSFILSQ